MDPTPQRVPVAVFAQENCWKFADPPVHLLGKPGCKSLSASYDDMPVEQAWNLLREDFIAAVDDEALDE